MISTNSSTRQSLTPRRKTMFNHADTIDTRDIIERIEGLESDIEDLRESEQTSDQTAADEELKNLLSIMDELKGNGGDEQWRGSWCPITLIHEDYFVEAMKELLKDIGDIPRPFPHYIAIDWEATADNLRMDYSSVEIEGHTYWFR